MVLKTTLWDQKTFSLLFWKILGLDFLFRKYFWMSHIDDVIKIHFKSSLQKTKKHSYWNLVRFEPSLRFEIIYFHDFTSSYWLLFHRTLQEGQEIFHMIKSEKNIDFSSTCIKTSRFFAQLILNNVMHHLIASFFRFWVTWPENRVRKNLPIDFEVIVVNYDPLYGVLYIKRKLMSSGTQKHSFHEFFSTSDEVTVISYFEWSKWPFCTKMCSSGHVTQYSKAYELNIPKKTFSWQKIAPESHWR